MRALSGAIIAAAALVGMGLTAIGLGTRYTAHIMRTEGTPDFVASHVRFQDIDNPMKLVLVLLVIALATGLAICFIGLMYHHERRHRESLLHHMHHNGGTAPTTPPGTSHRVTV